MLILDKGTNNNSIKAVKSKKKHEFSIILFFMGG